MQIMRMTYNDLTKGGGEAKLHAYGIGTFPVFSGQKPYTMAILMFRERAILKSVKHVKNLLYFSVCFILSFYLASYGKPLYSLTSYFVDTAFQLFSPYQDTHYDMDTDPVTFFALMIIISVYALILFILIKWLPTFLSQKRSRIKNSN